LKFTSVQGGTESYYLRQLDSFVVNSNFYEPPVAENSRDVNTIL